jgi:serine/threonine-protein kinase SRPK3
MSTPLTPYRASEDLKLMQWPEENLSLNVDERGGFYPAKLGEVFDEGRFVVTRKLGWGGFGNVWLVRDRKCVCFSQSCIGQYRFLISEKIDMLQ